MAAVTISGLGLDEYYRLREQVGARPAARIEQFLTYDNPQFQSSFVRKIDDSVLEASLLLEGVRCTACLWLIEESLRRISGVIDIEVNYVTRRAMLRWNAGMVQLSSMLRRLAILGYTAHPYRPAEVDLAMRAEKRQWLWRLFVSGFGMMQVMMYAVPAYIATAGELAPEYDTLMRWASFVLTLPVVVYSAQPFFLAAWRGIRMRKLGMDAPVALGIAIAFTASTWATFAQSGDVYFDSLTMFIFILLLGRYFEVLARETAGRSLSYLSRLSPTLAQRLKDFPTSRESESVAAAQLAAGDVFLVKPGEIIAADGVVLEGFSAVNEALLSGESMPVGKTPGGMVIGGSINVENPLFVRVTRVGEAGVLASIVRLSERAAAQRHPLAEFADRYARHFVWLTLGLSLIAAVVWLFIDPTRAPWIAVSILVATCPCALSLATPVALTVTTGQLAQQGLVVTRGHAIESLARATDFVFDKTGTLTEGRLSVVAFERRGGLSEDECLSVALALESASEHPIGRAIVTYARGRHAERAIGYSQNHSAVAGAGVEAHVAGHVYRLGNFAYCAALCPDTEAIAPISTRELSSLHTLVWLAREGELLARFDLSDGIRSGAAALIAALQTAGRRVHLLSGDSLGPVMHVAHSLNIPSFRGSATPVAKQDYVESLRRRGAIVAMIGDGVNDAPVLANADISIAMGDGAVLAQTQADAVLLGGRLEDLLRGWQLSVRSLHIIRQNLIWAFFYNPVIIPLAAVGLINPLVAALGMSASSLLVVLNALRLRSR